MECNKVLEVINLMQGKLLGTFRTMNKKRRKQAVETTMQTMVHSSFNNKHHQEELHCKGRHPNRLSVELEVGPTKPVDGAEVLHLRGQEIDYFQLFIDAIHTLNKSLVYFVNL